MAVLHLEVFPVSPLMSLVGVKADLSLTHCDTVGGSHPLDQQRKKPNWLPRIQKTLHEPNDWPNVVPHTFTIPPMKIGKFPMGNSSGISDACRAVVIAVVLFWQPSNLQAGDNVIVASATDQSRVATVSETIMGHAYSALGYKLNVSYLPGKQALYKSNHGETDAELVRIEAVGRKYPNLVQVPEALFDVRGMAFSWTDTIRFQSAQDLWGRRVGFVKGIQWAANIAEGQSPKLAENVHHLFELLANRQIDIALEAQLTGQPELKHFPNRGLVMLLETPIQFPVFHFLNKKHKNLTAPLAEEIRKMKERGEINRIFQDYYENTNSGHN